VVEIEARMALRINLSYQTQWVFVRVDVGVSSREKSFELSMPL